MAKIQPFSVTTQLWHSGVQNLSGIGQKGGKKRKTASIGTLAFTGGCLRVRDG
jgi:ribosomal protein L15